MAWTEPQRRKRSGHRPRPPTALSPRPWPAGAPSKTAVPASPAPGSGSGPAAVATPATAPDLVSETDPIGSKATPSYATTLAHDGEGNLHTITDPRGRVYTLTWAGSGSSRLVRASVEDDEVQRGAFRFARSTALPRW
ncbi:hypothetical protein [Streptomyces sp. NPDC004728]|uniref:hypothetical protein n=1 Tax=Streptomyces sp. NPDC004728 TaxID=3154289 RepID=UPI0033B087C3